MIGTIMTVAALAASAISSGVSAARANKAGRKARERNRQDMALNEKDMARSVYRNSLESPTAKGQLTSIRRNLERANNARDNANISGNRTHEQQLASKAATNAQLADAVNNVVRSQEQARAVKDERYMARANALSQRDQAYKQQQAQNWVRLGENLANAALQAGAYAAGAADAGKAARTAAKSAQGASAGGELAAQTPLAEPQAGAGTDGRLRIEAPQVTEDTLFPNRYKNNSWDQLRARRSYRFGESYDG